MLCKRVASMLSTWLHEAQRKCCVLEGKDHSVL